ncbi:MAG TPA: hypothetical protein VM103_00510 [Candidatus Paceibacterota bacterium]|nr:hypothetical protein [Candidatus Paceibacterota bacterium]
MPKLTFIVLSTHQMDTVRTFFEAVGLAFVAEKHGAGPKHLAATLAGGVVLEIYPGFPNRGQLGIQVASLTKTLDRLAALGFSPLIENPRRPIPVVHDPDGRRVVLSE